MDDSFARLEETVLSHYPHCIWLDIAFLTKYKLTPDVLSDIDVHENDYTVVAFEQNYLFCFHFFSDCERFEQLVMELGDMVALDFKGA